MTYSLTNQTGTESLLNFLNIAAQKLHIHMHIGNVHWAKGPLSTISETFTWTEPI